MLEKMLELVLMLQWQVSVLQVLDNFDFDFSWELHILHCGVGGVDLRLKG